MKLQDGCSMIIVECTYDVLQVFTLTERSELLGITRQIDTKYFCECVVKCFLFCLDINFKRETA